MAQPKVKETRIHEESRNNVHIFHVAMGEVSELCGKTMINNYHVFNLSDCSVVFKMS